MTDIATIQLNADSRPIAKAADDLDDLAQAGGKAETATNAVAKAAGRAKAPLKAVGNSADIAAKRMSVMRSRAQQAGYQIQDMAVQIQGGTSAFVAFGQQGSQLAGAFGPGGAIMGAFIALGSIAGGFLYNQFGLVEEKSEDLLERMDELTGGVTALTEAQKAFVLLESGKRIEDMTDKLEDMRKKEVEAKDEVYSLTQAIEHQSAAGKDTSVGLFWVDSLDEKAKDAREELIKLTAQISTTEVELGKEEQARKRILDGTTKQIEKERELNAARFGRTVESMEAKGESPIDKAMREYGKRQEIIEAHRQSSAANEAEANAATLANTALFESERTAIAKKAIEDREKLEQASAAAQMMGAGQLFGNLASIAKAGGKDQFENYKDLASAQTIIAGTMAGMKAFAEGGPFLGPALAATIAGVTAVNVAQIQSQEYQPRVNGGQMRAGGSFLVGERGPELVTMGNRNAHATPTAGLGGSQPVQVTNVYQISTGVAATVQAEVMRMAPAITSMSVKAYNEAVRKGGHTSRVAGRR